MGEGRPGSRGGRCASASSAPASSARCTPVPSRRAGARVVGVVASTPERTEQAVRARSAPSAASTTAEALVDSGDVDVVHVCTPNDLHRPLAEAALAAGKHVVCEKPLAVDARRRPRAARRRRRLPASWPRCRSSTASIRWSARRGPASPRHGRRRSGSCTAATSRTGCRRRATTTGASTPRRGGPSRAFADIGSHWCDLVEFVTGDRIAPLCAELVTAVPERVAGGDAHAFAARRRPTPARVAASTPRTSRSSLFRTHRGVTGSVVVSQISSGHKNQLRFEIAGADATLAFDQEQPDDAVGRPARAVARSSPATPPHLDPSAARLRDACRPATRRATRTASTPSSPTPTGRSPPARPTRSTACRPSPTASRAAQITDAVLRSAARAAGSTSTSPRIDVADADAAKEAP